MARSQLRVIRAIGLAAVLSIAGGCQGNVGSPISPAGLLSSPASTPQSPFGGQGIPMIPEPGSVPAGGGGTVNDTQTGKPGFNSFELNVAVHGAPPDTDLFFQFVADIDPATRGDGVCPGIPPAFPLAVLHTSRGGSASAHIKFPVPEGAFAGTFDSGEHADFRWRVVNATQTFDLRTPCVVLTGK